MPGMETRNELNPEGVELSILINKKCQPKSGRHNGRSCRNCHRIEGRQMKIKNAKIS